MINRKPFRVTNEQVKKIYSTSYNFRDQVTGITTYELALDLLDARELIDKQEAIIKEMRIHMNLMYMAYGKEGCTCKCCKKARMILEKTKDYAE